MAAHGCARRFDRLRLEAPSAWTEDAVRERRCALARIAAQVRERATTLSGDTDDAEREDARTALDAARSDLHDALAAACLHEGRLDESAESTLRAIARIHSAGQALHGVVAEMAGERDGAGAVRESLYRGLAREGEAAPGGDASAGALEAGMERLRRR